MWQFFGQHLVWAFGLVVVAAITFCVSVIFTFGALGPIGKAAFLSGGHPKGPEAFGIFAVQFSRMVIVCLIVLATVILACSGHLTEAPTGLLSGVAGYVLGGVGSEKRRTQESDK